jgi:hypothetical protein
MLQRSGKREISIEPGYPEIETGSPTSIMCGTTVVLKRRETGEKRKSKKMFALIRALHENTQMLWGPNDDSYSTTDYYM